MEPPLGGSQNRRMRFCTHERSECARRVADRMSAMKSSHSDHQFERNAYANLSRDARELGLISYKALLAPSYCVSVSDLLR